MTPEEIRASLTDNEIPEHLHDGIVRYLVQGIKPGGFLRAIIRMDVEEAHIRVFPPTRLAIPKLMTWFTTQAPPECSGTPTGRRGLDREAGEGSPERANQKDR